MKDSWQNSAHMFCEICHFIQKTETHTNLLGDRELGRYYSILDISTRTLIRPYSLAQSANS